MLKIAKKNIDAIYLKEFMNGKLSTVSQSQHGSESTRSSSEMSV